MEYFPLSQAQKRIWYSQKKYTESPLYNIGGTVKISGTIELTSLKQAIEFVYWTNEALRLRFLEKEHEILQYISEEKFYVDMIDFSCMEDAEKAFSDWCKEQASKPFHMVNERLCYFVVFRINANSVGYFIKIHHIIADGWSIKLLTEQVKAAYEQIVHDEKVNVECNPSYLDYVKREEQYLTSEECRTAGEYWKRKFSVLPEQTGRQAVVTDIQGKRKIFYLEEGMQKKLQEFLKINNLSLQSFFLCIALIYEYKVSGAEDIVLGIPLLGRLGRRERNTFGTFTNTMPFRFKVQRDEPVHLMMKTVSASIHGSFRYQKYPYNMLQDELQTARKGIGRLYHTCVNYYNTEICSEIDGLHVTNTEFYNGYQDYSLQIIIRHWNAGKLQLDFDYQIKGYTEQQIENMYHIFEVLISQVLQNDCKTIKELLLVDVEERDRLLYKCNQTKSSYPKTKSVMDLFSEAVKNFPNRIAVTKGEECISYDQLNKLANQAAKYLLDCGICLGDKVAMIPEYTIESIAVILGIMKCGAVYIPIDVKAPKERIRIITEKAKAKCLIVENENPFLHVTTLRISDMLHEKGTVTEINQSNYQKTVYILYTSGSTGIPKGVLVTNRNLVNYLCWAAKTYIKKEEEVFPLFSSFAFDFTMTSLLLPLITGNEIRLYDNREHINILKHISEEGKATILKITPSQVPLMKEARSNCSVLHTIILGGEELRAEVCKELKCQYGNDVNIFNEYGPTEATIGCMIYQYNGADTGLSVPIGQPIDNVQVYVLDKDKNPLPINMVGEIYIGGDGVAEGYYESELDTEKCFIPDIIREEGILYKTGDLAFRGSDNHLVYCGRVDRQVKIRGHRIELREIEERILISGLVQQTHIKMIEVHPGTKTLCAYITGMIEDDKPKLKKYLSEFLPEYMIPAFYILLNEFPINENGKLDENSLPMPVKTNGEEMIQHEKEIQLLVDTMKKVLMDDGVSAETNFFELGGDSIKAILVSSRVYEKGYILSSVDILSHPDLYQMSAYMKKRSTSMCEQGIVEGFVPKTPIIDWFLSRKFAQAGYYNQSMLLEWKQSMPFFDLNEVMLQLINHHDGLRMNVDKESERLFYNNEHLDQRSVLKVIDHSGQNILLEQIINQETEPEFDIYRDLLFRPYLILVGAKKYIYIILHHLITDGISMRILLEDLTKLLLQQQEGQYFCLPDKAASFKEYAEVFNRVIEDYLVSRDKSKGNNCTIIHPKNVRSACSYKDTLENLFSFSEEQTILLCEVANKVYGAKTEELLVAAVVIALAETLDRKEILIELESHGRDFVEEINVNRTIGWFTLIQLVHVKVISEGIDNQIKEIKNQIRTALKKSNRYFQVGGDIRFNYLGEFIEYGSEVLAMKKIMRHENVGLKNEFNYMADINVFVWQKKLYVHTRYGAEIENVLVNMQKELFRILQLWTKDIDACVYMRED